VTAITKVLLLEVMTIGIAAFPIFAVALVSAIAGRVSRWRASRVDGAPPRRATATPLDAPVDEVRTLSRRELVERAAGLTVLGASAGLVGWGMVRGRHAFEIEEVVVRIDGLPRVLEGYTLAQISDLHVGAFVGERELAEGLSRLEEVRADLVVATGDLLDIDPRHIPTMARALGRVRARDGFFAVVGNHDYYTDAPAIMAALRSVGVGVLDNGGAVVRAGDGGGFALLGVDDYAGARRGEGPKLRRARARVPADCPSILLAHQPDFFHEAAGKVALQLSGHTHGGQVNPIVRPIRLVSPFVSGRYERAGSVLWVNRGFGTTGPPTRIGAPPEITKIVLVGS
jgi:predicted MPP superfamily phosphohydrolase